eukprot:scaffold12782_cov129-Isochrysis_galbana.AAC.4
MLPGIHLARHLFGDAVHTGEDLVIAPEAQDVDERRTHRLDGRPPLPLQLRGAIHRRQPAEAELFFLNDFVTFASHNFPAGRDEVDARKGAKAAEAEHYATHYGYVGELAVHDSPANDGDECEGTEGCRPNGRCHHQSNQHPKEPVANGERAWLEELVANTMLGRAVAGHEPRQHRRPATCADDCHGGDHGAK